MASLSLSGRVCTLLLSFFLLFHIARSGEYIYS